MNPKAAFTGTRRGQSNMEGHMALNAFNQQQNQEKAQAAQQEAAYYSELNKNAEEFLTPDRNRFDGMVAKMQSSIRDKIAMYGGDRREFLRNGGHGIMQNFSNELKNSKEYETYTTNKANYVKIKDALSSGLGHRISMRDKKALEQYEANGRGNITYSGLQSELEMPNENNYDLGANIPLTDILYNGDNYMKVLGNYMANFPNDQNPSVEKMLGFLKLTGYDRQKGSNREKERAARKARLAASKDVKVKKDTRPQLFTTNLTKMMDYVPKGTTVNSLFETENGSYIPKKSLETTAKSDTFLSSNIEGRWKPTSHAINEDESGLDVHTESIVGLNWLTSKFGDRWRPAEAQEIAPQHKTTIADYFLGVKPNENGEYKLDPSQISNMFSAKGVQLEGDNNLEPGEYDTNYKNLGVHTGVYTQKEDGTNQMIMQIEDNDGEIKVDEQKEHVDGLRDSEVKMGYFIALQNTDNDRIYYKRINMEDTNSLRGLSDQMGGADNLRAQYESSQRLTEDFENAAAPLNEAEANFDQDLLLIDQQTDASDAFQVEAEMYANPENRNENRSSIMKSFYAMTGIDPGSQGFHEFMSYAPNTAKAMRTYGNRISDEQLIDMYFTEISEGDPKLEASNMEEAKVWKNAYKRYLKINKE